MGLRANVTNASIENIINLVIDASKKGQTYIDLNEFDIYYDDEIIKKVIEHFETENDQIEEGLKGCLKWINI